MYKVNCVVCSKEFKTNHPKYLCCSAQCGVTHKTNTRYKRESGNWSLYFRHLLSKKKSSNLLTEDLIRLLARQKGKCALSGIKLTWHDLTVKEFIQWCKKVAKNGIYKKP